MSFLMFWNINTLFLLCYGGFSICMIKKCLKKINVLNLKNKSYICFLTFNELIKINLKLNNISTKLK